MIFKPNTRPPLRELSDWACPALISSHVLLFQRALLSMLHRQVRDCCRAFHPLLPKTCCSSLLTIPHLSSSSVCLDPDITPNITPYPLLFTRKTFRAKFDRKKNDNKRMIIMPLFGLDMTCCVGVASMT